MIYDWTYLGNPFLSPDSNHVGFVYCITDISTNKKYIGKKKFWTTIKKPTLKGQKRARKIVKESDWVNYFGSSEKVKALVSDLGKENFRREILYFCETLGEMSYVEAYEQLSRNVLLSDEYYNEFVGCRINGSHLNKVRDKILASVGKFNK